VTEETEEAVEVAEVEEEEASVKVEEAEVETEVTEEVAVEVEEEVSEEVMLQLKANMLNTKLQNKLLPNELLKTKQQPLDSERTYEAIYSTQVNINPILILSH